MDVNHAFLHGDLNEEVDMEPPLSFKPLKPGLYCCLQNSLHRLKQASSNLLWNILFFLKQRSIMLAFLVYVDDILLIGNDPKKCEELKRFLDANFKIKDFGSLKYFLGIELERPSRGFSLSNKIRYRYSC